MKSKSKIVFLIPFICLHANTSINGSSGVFETPDAKILDDWSIRAFYNYNRPYSYYGIALSPLPFLEANFHITNIANKRKDPSANIKLHLFKEGRFNPSAVVGFDDIWGNGLYSSKYIAFGKKISYFDITLGYALGRLGGQNLKKYNKANNDKFNNSAINFLKHSHVNGGSVFANLAFHATPRVDILAEYSPIDHTLDKINPFLNTKYKKPSSHVNVGLKYKAFKNATVSAALLRGNSFLLGFAYDFGLKNEKILQKPKLKIYFNENQQASLDENITYSLKKSGYKNVATSKKDKDIFIELENKKHNFDLKAIGEAFNTANTFAKNSTQYLHVKLKNDNIFYKNYSINKDEFDLYKNEKLSDSYAKDALKITTLKSAKSSKIEDRLTYFISPKFKSFSQNDSKPFSTKAVLNFNANYLLYDGLNLFSSISVPFYNDIKSTHEFMKYENNDKATLSSLTLNYTNKGFFDTFYAVEAGYFDDEFFGIDIQMYKNITEKFGLGVQYQAVNYRKINSTFKMQNDTKNAVFANVDYLFYPQYNLHANVKAGRFLHGDVGARVDIFRTYKDFTMGIFAAFTNSEKNNTPKGIYLQVPLDIFFNSHNKASYTIQSTKTNKATFATPTKNLINHSENDTALIKKRINEMIR